MQQGEQADTNGGNPSGPPSSRRSPFHRRRGRLIRLEGDEPQEARLDLWRVLREHHRGEGGRLFGVARLPQLLRLVAVSIAHPEKRK